MTLYRSPPTTCKVILYSHHYRKHALWLERHYKVSICRSYEYCDLCHVINVPLVIKSKERNNTLNRNLKSPKAFPYGGFTVNCVSLSHSTHVISSILYSAMQMSENVAIFWHIKSNALSGYLSTHGYNIIWRGKFWSVR